MKNAEIIINSNFIYPGYGDTTFSGGIAIGGKKIIAVGGKEEIQHYCVKDTKVYDYGDELVMPGFIDAHDHAIMGAINNSEHMCNELINSTSEEDAVAIIKKYADEHPDEKRIRGFGWFPANWNDAPLPTKASLDAAISDRPVYLNSADGHSMWLNTCAIEETGFTVEMKFQNGRLGIDENGELNGQVFEPGACFKAMEYMMEFDRETRKEIFRDFMSSLAECGVTSISDMSADICSDSNYEKYMALKDLDDAGELTSRINIYMNLFDRDNYDDIKEYQKIFNGEKLRIAGLKGFLDGVTSTYTGLLLEPYADRVDTCGEGVPLMTQDEANKFVTEGNREGLQVRIHCIAGGSVRMALDAYQESVRVNGRLPFMNTIEHIETMSPDDYSRFAELKVIASVQPAHLPLDANEKIIRVGRKRCKTEWPFRSLIDAGTVVAMGTDYPVVELNPFPNIYAAVTRCNYDGTPAGVSNGEYMTMAEALSGYTLGSAKAYNMDKFIGTLEVEKYADIIVVDRNLFKIDPAEILDAKVVLTMSAGRITYKV